MEFIRSTLLVVVVVVVGVGWFLAGYSSRKSAKKSETTMNNISSKTMNFWSSLTEAERKELGSIETLFAQEQWVEEKLPMEVRALVKPEQVILELANRGHVNYGSGLPRRLALAAEVAVSRKPPTKPVGRQRKITRSRVVSLKRAHLAKQSQGGVRVPSYRLKAFRKSK